MNGLQLLTIGLVAVIGVLCAVMYSRSYKMSAQLLEQRESLGRLSDQLRELVEIQHFLRRRVEELATDVLQREIYKSADERHQSAVQDAACGMSLSELVDRHGLSSDEAALIVALHGKSLSAGTVSSSQSTATPESAQVLSNTGRK